MCFEWAKTKSQSKLSHEPFGISVCTWSHMYFLHTYILLGFPCSWRGRTTLHSTACVSGRLADQQQLAPLLTILSRLQVQKTVAFMHEGQWQQFYQDLRRVNNNQLLKGQSIPGSLYLVRRVQKRRCLVYSGLCSCQHRDGN